MYLCLGGRGPAGHCLSGLKSCLLLLWVFLKIGRSWNGHTCMGRSEDVTRVTCWVKSLIDCVLSTLSAFFPLGWTECHIFAGSAIGIWLILRMKQSLGMNKINFPYFLKWGARKKTWNILNPLHFLQLVPSNFSDCVSHKNAFDCCLIW